MLISSCGKNVQSDNIPNKYKPNETAKINLQLGVEYMRRKDYDIALNKLQKALRIDNNYADAHNAIAVLYGRLDMSMQAQIHYKKALVFKPNDSDIHNNYGQFLCEQKQWLQAEKHFLKAVENPVYRNYEIPYTNAGLCAINNNDLSKASKYLHQALQKNPKFPRALYRIADLNYEQNNYVKAYKYLQRYVAVAKHTPKTLWLGIKIARAMGNRNIESSYILLLRRNFPDATEIGSL